METTTENEIDTGGILGFKELNLSLGIQIAQCRYYLQPLGPNVGIICILGPLGFGQKF